MTLAQVLKRAYASRYSKYDVICPVCGHKTCQVGEYVEHAKVSPDSCFICGWIEGNGTEAYPDNYEYVKKCWELQICPYKNMEDMYNANSWVSK